MSSGSLMEGGTLGGGAASAGVLKRAEAPLDGVNGAAVDDNSDHALTAISVPGWYMISVWPDPASESVSDIIWAWIKTTGATSAEGDGVPFGTGMPLYIYADGAMQINFRRSAYTPFACRVFVNRIQ